MRAFELEQLLRELATANPARRKSLWRIAMRAPTQLWFDATWRSRIAEAAAQYELPFEAANSAALRVGEAWVLLYANDRKQGMTGRIQFAAELRPDDHCDSTSIVAVRSAHIALAGLAASHLRTLPVGLSPERFALTLPEAAGIVEGRSLGLASAIALMSAALGRPARTDVAASACVDEDGTLSPVTHLREKLQDLTERHPEVTCVLVAVGQQGVPDLPQHIQVRECASLADALGATALEIDTLESADLEAFEVRLSALVEAEAVRTHPPERWLRLAVEASAIGRALQSEAPDKAAKAIGLAVLFALHAGFQDLAESFQNQVRSIESPPSPAVEAWLAIVAATRAIDRATERLADPMFEDAVRLAEQALADTLMLPRDDRERLHGQALGTLGRAYLHAGKPGHGLSPLRDAVFHHNRWDAKEAPRTMIYLATCLRHAGQIQDAAGVCRDALACVAAMPRRALSQTTRLYAQLELGRCALVRGDAWQALREFQAVVDGQESDAEHPRISALRGIAAAQRVLGAAADASAHRDRCVSVAAAAQTPLYRLLGVMAIGDSLIAGEPCASDLQRVWNQTTGACTTEETQRVLARWVY